MPKKAEAKKTTTEVIMPKERVEKQNILKNKINFVGYIEVNGANPNGDPLDENKPRLDEDTETNIVTDVRLKRTIRDFINQKYNDETMPHADQAYEG